MTKGEWFDRMIKHLREGNRKGVQRAQEERGLEKECQQEEAVRGKKTRTGRKKGVDKAAMMW